MAAPDAPALPATPVTAGSRPQPWRPPARAFWIPLLLLDALLLLFLPHVTTAAVLIAAHAAMFALVRRPAWPLVLLLLGAPFLAPFELSAGNYTLALIGIRGLVLFGWLHTLPGARLGRLLGRIARAPAVWVFVALSLLLVVRAAGSPAPVYADDKAKSYLLANGALFLAPLLYATYWGRPRALDRFLQAALVIGGLFAAIGLGTALAGGGELGLAAESRWLFRDAPARLTWFGQHPIWSARLLAIWLVLLVWMWRRRRLPFVLFLPLVALALFLILGTGSRGPLGALLLAPLAMLLLPGAALPAWARRWQRRLRILLPTLALLLLILLALLPATTTARWFGFVSRVPAAEVDGEGAAAALEAGLGRDPSLRFRLHIAERTWRMLPAVLPWGSGTGSFPAIVFLRDFRLYPHNIEAELLIELGWPGLLLFLLWLLLLARQLHRRAAAGDATSYALAVLLAMAWWNAQVSGDVTGNGELWFWAGLTVGSSLARPASRLERPLRQ